MNYQDRLTQQIRCAMWRQLDAHKRRPHRRTLLTLAPERQPKRPTAWVWLLVVLLSGALGAAIGAGVVIYFR